MSWLSALRGWLGGRAHAGTSSRSFDPAAFVSLCEERPEEARALLAADQSELANEIELTFRAYDERLEALAERVHTISPEEFRREAETIREAHDGLRRALRRLDVSAKTVRELERELAEWQDRADDAPLHADHPRFRAEIIASELRGRGATTPVSDARFVRTREAEVIESPVISVETLPRTTQANALLLLTHDDRAPRASTIREIPTEVLEPLTMPQVEHLLRAIREATREAERWHAIPEAEHDEDAIAQVRYVRDLHTALKRLDREQGIERDRMELAIHPRALR